MDISGSVCRRSRRMELRPDRHNDILFHEIEYGWLLFGYFDVDNDDNLENDRTNCFYAVNESGPFEIEEIDYWMKIPELPK